MRYRDIGGRDADNDGAAISSGLVMIPKKMAQTFGVVDPPKVYKSKEYGDRVGSVTVAPTAPRTNWWRCRGKRSRRNS